MGFSGTFLLCRSEVELHEIEVINDRSEGLEWASEFLGGWRVGQYDGNDFEGDIVGLLAELTVVTGAPVLSGYVVDSNCVLVTGGSDENGLWKACLDRDSSRSLLDEYDDDLDELFPQAAEAAELARRWAVEAGLVPDQTALLALLTDGKADPMAEDLFFEFLQTLGLRELPHST